MSGGGARWGAAVGQTVAMLRRNPEGGSGRGARAALIWLFACLWTGCDRSPAQSVTTAPKTTGAPPAALGVAAGPAWLEDATAAVHLDFVHVAGTNWFMADQVGSGVVVQDFDNDGRADLYLVQNGGADSGVPNALYQQQPDGRFQALAAGSSGAGLVGRGMGAVAGDLNNDGLADLVVTEYGAVRLLWNHGEMKFQEVGRAAGLDNPRWAAPASFIDFDRDGWLDLVVGNYLDYDPTQVCHDVQGRRDFCSPEAFPATTTRLWRNVTGTPGAQPRFVEVTERAGLTRLPGAALGLVCADFNGDGWPDIFCADDGRVNRLFVNQHDGTFREEAAMRGLAFNAMGRTAANMGVAWADFDGDGRGDLFVTHLTDEFHSLYCQDQAGLFTDTVARAGLQQQAWRGTGFGTVAADFDNDGNVDLAVANGLVSRATPPQSPVRLGVSPWWATYAQRPQVFANTGQGHFKDQSPANPAFSGTASVGRSLAVADLDRDGGLDLVLGNVAGPAVVLRNVAPKRGYWLQLRLVDPAHGGRDAIGAEVTLRAGGRRQWAVLQPAMSYLSSHEPMLHFGLGAIPVVDSIEVRWPEGVVEKFPGGAAGQRRVLARGSGQL